MPDLGKLDDLLHTYRGPSGNIARHVHIHHIIKQNTTSNMERLPIQQKKQGNKKSRVVQQWSLKKFEKGE